MSIDNLECDCCGYDVDGECELNHMGSGRWWCHSCRGFPGPTVAGGSFYKTDSHDDEDEDDDW